MLKRLTQGLLRSVGREIRRYDQENSQWLRLRRMLQSNRASVVLDVGASTGGFATGLLNSGFPGRIVSFEPMTVCHDQLRIAAAAYPRWTIAQRIALGDANGTASLNVAENIGSSSILPVGRRNLEIAPRSRYVAVEPVEMVRLDEIFEKFVYADDLAFLKLDVQGYEGAVLKGAQRCLSRITGVQAELTFETLYEGQALFEELFHHLTALGFAPWAFFPAFTDPATGRMVQVDGIFFRAHPAPTLLGSLQHENRVSQSGHYREG